VDAAKAGTLFIDLAASELGGNVAGSQPGKTVTTPQQAQIVGAGDMASQLPASASDMFAKNVQAVLNAVVQDGKLVLDVDDEVVGELLATYQGDIISSRVREAMKLPPREPAKPAESPAESTESKGVD